VALERGRDDFSLNRSNKSQTSMSLCRWTAVWTPYLNELLPKTFRRVKSRSTFWPIFLLLIPGIVRCC
jgi:hypothetical protein